MGELWRVRCGGAGLSGREGGMTAYLTNESEVEVTQGGPPEEGWINMQVQFLVNAERGGADNIVLGRTVFAPGARHEWHRHAHGAEFQYVVEGEGLALNDGEEVPVKAGSVWYTPANEWHGFHNTSDADAVMIWGWIGGGSREVVGYERRE